MVALSTDTCLRNFTAEDFAALFGGGTPPPPEPDPTIGSLTPATGVVGTPVTVTVAGTNFVSGSTVEVNGAAAPTIFVSATQLTASYTPVSAGIKQITVRNPSGMESGNSTFTVTAT